MKVLQAQTLPEAVWYSVGCFELRTCGSFSPQCCSTVQQGKIRCNDRERSSRSRRRNPRRGAYESKERESKKTFSIQLRYSIFNSRLKTESRKSQKRQKKIIANSACREESTSRMSRMWSTLISRLQQSSISTEQVEQREETTRDELLISWSDKKNETAWIRSQKWQE